MTTKISAGGHSPCDRGSRTAIVAITAELSDFGDDPKASNEGVNGFCEVWQFARALKNALGLSAWKPAYLESHEWCPMLVLCAPTFLRGLAVSPAPSLLPSDSKELSRLTAIWFRLKNFGFD